MRARFLVGVARRMVESAPVATAIFKATCGGWRPTIALDIRQGVNGRRTGVAVVDPEAVSGLKVKGHLE